MIGHIRRFDNSSPETAMAWLTAQGFIKQVDGVAGSDLWVLTSKAAASLRVLNSLANPVRFLVARDELPNNEKTAFELHEVLLIDGWKHQMCVAKPLPTYKHGNDKVWGLSSVQKRFSHGYFCALLAAADHGLDVLPFLTKAYYTALLQGEVHIPKKTQE